MKSCQIVDIDIRTDKRGWVVEPIRAEDLASGRIRNIHIVSMEPGAVRGNHYHLNRTEHTVIIGFPCEFMVLNRQTQDTESLTKSYEKPLLLSIPPNVTHAFKNPGDHIIYLICYSDQEFDSDNPDVMAHKILE